MATWKYPDPDGSFEHKYDVGPDGSVKHTRDFLPRNPNRDRYVGPSEEGDSGWDSDDDDNEVSRKMTIAAKMDLDDIAPNDPSLGIAGGNQSTYYPKAIHGPVKNEAAGYHRFIHNDNS